MSVKKHDNGKWYCRFTIKGERKHLLCIGATDKAEAEALEAQYKYKLMQQQNGVIPRDTKNVYFNRLKELYLNHASVNNKSYRNQIYYINKIVEYFGNSIPANLIKPKDIEEYKEYLRSKGLKNSSINRFLEILSKMFNLAIDNNELAENPVSKVKKLREDNHRIRYLLAEEEKRMIDSIEADAPFLKNIVITALQTGMRRGEIFNLKWCDIDFNMNIIHVLETKSGYSREIPISPVLERVLLSIPKISEYVFINPQTGNPYVDIKKSFNKVIKNAKIKNFRFHDIRHTVATRLIEQGADLLVVKEILGHRNIQTTMRYAHALPDRKLLAIKNLCKYSL